MRIGSAAPAAQQRPNAANAKPDLQKQIQDLDKRKKELEAQIKEYQSDDKLDPDSKKTMIGALQDKIANIDKQIQDLNKLQSEMLKEQTSNSDDKKETKQPALQREDEFVRDPFRSKDAKLMSTALSANSLLTQLKDVDSLAGKLEANERLLDYDISVSRRLNVDTKVAEADLKKISSGIDGLHSARAEVTNKLLETTDAAREESQTDNIPESDEDPKGPVIGYDELGNPIREEVPPSGQIIDEVI